MAGRSRSAQPPARPGKALRWVAGRGTCLVPCTVLGRSGPEWEKDEHRGYRVRFPDGVEQILHSDYVLVDA